MVQVKKNSLTFGDWLSNKRTNLECGLLALEKLTNVDDSTLSRIERKLSEPTLFTAARICQGLGVTLKELLSELRGESSGDDFDKRRFSTIPDALTATDLELFSDTFFRSSENTQKFLQSFADDVLYNSARIGVTKTTREPSFTTGEFSRLLHGSTLVHLELRVPPPLDAWKVLDIFERGGVVTLKEVGIYAKEVREQGPATTVTLQQLSKNALSTLLRLERGDAEYIALNDALILSDELGNHSTIRHMIWLAVDFHWRFLQFEVSTHFSKAMAESQVSLRSRLVSLLFILARWQEYLSPNDRRWLHELRSELEKIRQFDGTVRTSLKL
jgi:transcriptional regulator with XRE-family HTH domain